MGWAGVEKWARAVLRVFDPDDPVKYDIALFGLGVEAKGGSALPVVHLRP